CVDTEAFHHAEASRYGPVAHQPHDHMRTFSVLGNPVPKRIMGRSCLWHLIMLFRLYRMDEIREFNRVLHEKYRHIISNQIKVAFIGIEFCCKAADITRNIHGTSVSGYG